MDLAAISRRLSRAVTRLRFAPPVDVVYNPLDYARVAHERYLGDWARPRPDVLLLGMNPGPWGMVQTGVPFGEVRAVRDWLGIDAGVERPGREHPKRPVEGFGCRRSEVSGERLWGWARAAFGSPDRFFARFFVHNYCPLAFCESTGRNRTPDKLPAAETTPLLAACDRALREVVAALEPGRVVGVGAFAEKSARRALRDLDVPIGRILHPSPASPRANRGWAEQAEAELRAQGVRLP